MVFFRLVIIDDQTIIFGDDSVSCEFVVFHSNSFPRNKPSIDYLLSNRYGIYVLNVTY